MRTRRDEQGLTLVLVLVVVSVLGLLVSTTLVFQDTTFRAQTAYTSKRQADLAADAAIDSMIERIRDDREVGRFVPELGPGQSCAEDASFEYEDPTLDESVVVECTVEEPESGTLRGGVGRPADHVVLALGGVEDDGNDPGDTSDDHIPFCDERHDQAGCEAGLFVGPGVDNDPTGFLIAPNGSTAEKPLVFSNGAIDARRVTEGDGGLRVLGDVTARRACSGFVRADTLNCDAQVGLEDPPGWTHEWGEPLEVARDAVTRQPLAPPFSTWLPPRAVPEPEACGHGFVQFEPGWYYQLEKMNTLMRDCPETMFWFQPGVYYFDFTDVGTDPLKNRHWLEPRNFAQVVGGSPQGWTPCENDVCDGQEQPRKTMTANTIKWNELRWDSTDVYDANLIDGDTVTATLNMSPQNTPFIKWGDLGTPLPDLADVDRVIVRVAHRGPTDENDHEFARGYPKMRITTTTTGGWCDVFLRDPRAIDGNPDPDSYDPANRVWRADGSTYIDLTAGCPAAEGGTVSGNGSFPASFSGSTADVVNGIKLEYRAKKGSKNPTPQVHVDGAELLVDFTGPPSPPFPGGCDPTGPGVQFVFGNLSRMIWQGNDMYVELCGSVEQPRRDEHSIAVYGLSHEGSDGPPPYVSAPPPQRYLSGHRDAGLGIGARSRLATRKRYNGTWMPTPGDADQGNRWWADDYDQDWWEEADDAFGTYEGPAGGTVNNRRVDLVLRLPGDAVPAGSVIESAQVRLRYVASDNVGRVSLTAEPGSTDADEGEPDGGSNKLGSTDLVRVNTRPPGQLGIDDPDRWLFETGPRPEDQGDTPENEREIWTDIYGDDPDERDLVARMDTTNGWNGGTLTVEFERTRDNGTWEVLVDAIEVVVEYRPVGEPRPLRGCLTTRTTLEDDESNEQYRGAHAIHNGPPFRDSSSDAPYGTAPGTNDSGSCALMVVSSRSQREGAKLHVAGAVYAPTAALELAGVDNEAPFVSDGVVVRHLTARRWKEAPEVPAVGGGITEERDDREVVLTATVGGQVIARATVRFHDHGALDPELIGQRVEILSWRRRPP